ncbi:MAG TPA: amino acid adenylation domain-containing protein, partial [Thermoanaerobaculia bacterium]|nr:amino acid adenylation domain-containing protein [Thermoanaerobaculia bacterium]
LRRGECDLALAGGVNLIVAPEGSIYTCQVGGISRDGRCRAFSAAASGTVRGEGAGFVVLKRLSDALAAGDPILALVRGSAVNQDGRSNGLTAPNGLAQQRVIRSALADGGVAAAEVSYVEAHGTGTPLGDPVEVQALGTVAGGREGGRALAIGSVKTNIGHLEAAAGIAGVIKVVLALQHRQLPPSLHCDPPSPHIPFAELPVRVQRELGDWPADGLPRIAGVSSFGFSGTNAHVVLQEAPPPAAAGDEAASAAGEERCRLLPLSARSREALRDHALGVAAWLRAPAPGRLLRDVCWSAARRRSHHPFRLSLAVRSAGEAAAHLEAFGAGEARPGMTAGQRVAGQPPRLVFVFPGQGPLWSGMACRLLAAEPSFRAALERCDELVGAELGWSVLRVLAEGVADPSKPDVEIVQPLVFCIQVALAELLRARGVVPDAVVGHSMGEVTAAQVSGALSLPDAVRVLCRRSQVLKGAVGNGAMALVELGVAEAQEAIAAYGQRVTVAVSNSARSTVLSGETAAIEEVVRELLGRGLFCRRMKIDVAGHGPRMEPYRAAMLTGLELAPRQPAVPFHSTVAGVEAEAPRLDAEYWWRNLRQPVLFLAAAERLIAAGHDLFLELSPHPTLTLPIAETFERLGRKGQAIATLSRDRDDDTSVLGAIGALYCAGRPIDWGALDSGGARFVGLPNHPFRRERHWFAAPAPPAAGSERREDPSMQTAPPQVSTTAGPAASQEQRPDGILEEVVAIVARQMEIGPEQLDPEARFLEMGADSIVLTTAVKALEARFGVPLTLRRLFEDLGTAGDLAGFLRARLGPQAGPAPPVAPAAIGEAAAAVPAAPAAGPAAAPVDGGAFPAVAAARGPQAAPGTGDLLAQQLRIYSETFAQLVGQQLQALGTAASHAAALPASTAAVEPSAESPSAESPSAESPAAEPAAAMAPARQAAAHDHPAEPADPRRAAHLAELIARYECRTARSKQAVDRARPILADRRAFIGYRTATKEMLYPLVRQRALGGRLWDLDGNEYVDVTLGAGVHLFGHHPPFIQEALRRQLERGYELGPRAEDAEEAAELVCRLTGKQRASFCNSGTEAVMLALRLARAATGREKVAIFVDSYHGHSDGTLAGKSFAADHHGAAVALGVPRNIPERNLLVLDYCDPGALQAVAEHGRELAAVLVEPIQSRRPDRRPREFLHRLRQLTAESGTALVCDEIISGFRVHPAGAQGWFGLEADLAVYGKVVGGGMPIGIVAGKAEYLDVIDGGAWRFGDGSSPHSPVTVTGGTFSQHPLAMAAAVAVLREIERRGPALQQQLNQRTDVFAARLNAFFEREAVPLRLLQTSSLFRFTFPAHLDLFFYHLMEKGVFIWEWRSGFLCTAHTEEDLDHVAGAVESSVRELRGGGFLPDPPGAGRRQAADAAQPVELGLAPAQKLFWALAQLGDDAASACIESGYVDLRGPLDPQAMERAARQVVGRHEALRLRFRADGSAQSAVPRLELRVPLVDLSGGAAGGAADPEARALAWLAAEGRTPFSLTSGPVIRFHLLRLAPERHHLVVASHHIVNDGWSFALIMEQLWACYRADLAGGTVELAPAMQLGDYLRQLAQQGEGPEMAAHAAYWQEQLAGGVPVLELPTDRQRPPVKTYAGARRSMPIGPEPLAGARQLGRDHGATLFMTLYAAYVALLRRLTGQGDLVVAFPISGRTLAGSETVVGPLLNLLPVRSRLAGAPTVGRLLGHVKQLLLAAFDHQEYRFDGFRERLQLRHDPSRSPVYSTVFNIDPPLALPELPGLAADVRPTPIHYTKFDLVVDILDKRRELLVSFDFNTDLFDGATIARAMGHFRNLLAAMAADPGCRLDDLPLLGEAERHQLDREWADPRHEAPPDRCVHDLFAEQAARRPAHVALVCGDRQMTYGELDRRGNQLARHLRRLGVGPETLVGLCVRRSPEMVVAMHGVLKAGGAYLPLDPQLPADRLEFMVRDAAVRLAIADHELPVGLAALPGLTRLRLDDALAASRRLEDTPLGRLATPENLAYVTYTSGSTGRPKGAEIPHRSLLGFQFGVDYVRFDDLQVSFQYSSVAWDVAIHELWPALIQGGRAVLHAGGAITPADLAAAIRDHGVSRLWVTTSLFNAIVDGDPRVFAGVRELLVGGEALSPAHVRRAREALPEVRIVNGYGPAECTCFSNCYPIPASLPATPAAIPIGRPIGDRRVHLLDRALRPVPLGVTGELSIGGPGVARGYLRRPELTAEKFIPDPWSEQPGGRLYRTGDLARWLVDGTVDYLGRLDHQVKIRGYRIELGEIEARLGEHPAVAECAVVARAAASGDRFLAAYVVASRGRGVEAAALRDHLRALLPDYMVPQAFVPLAALPLSANGKLDRARLPEPEPAAAAEPEAPRDLVEEVIAEIWAEVLGKSRVGIHDDFFDLGGQSLAAARILARIGRVLRVEVPMRSLFLALTVAGLAREIEALRRDAGESAAVPPLAPVARRQDESLPLSFAQERLWFLHRLSSDSPVYNVPVAYRLAGPLRAERLAACLSTVVRRHEVLRTIYPTAAGRPVQRVQPAGAVELEIFDLRSRPGAEREAEALRISDREAERPFDLAIGPLLRAALVRLADAESLLLLTLHHIAADGWSIGILNRELSTLYGSGEGDLGELPELPLQYADYAAWQRQALTRELLLGQLAFWREQLAGAPATLELPADLPRPPVPSHRGACAGFVLPRDLADRLRALAREQGATLFVTLLAAWQALLARLSRQADVLVGCPIAGRNRVEVEELIGCFVNSLALRADLRRGPTFGELVDQVMDRVLDASAHQELPFDKLVQELRPERQLSHSPLFQAMFGLLDAGLDELALTGLAVTAEARRRHTAKVDVILWLLPRGEETHGELEYSLDLYEAATARRWSAQYVRLLEAVAAAPERRVGELPLLSREERSQLLGEWGPGAAVGAPAAGLWELLAAQAARRPEAVAVSSSARRLSYGELVREAGSLARRLRSAGVVRGSRVGVCLERSVEAVVALAGVLGAGGAYVPLEPSEPAERRRWVMADAGVTVVVSERRLAAAREAGGGTVAGARWVWLEDAGTAAAGPGPAAAAVAAGVAGGDLAYVVYTSGSTGGPKGVAVPQRAVSRLVLGSDYLQVSAEDRVGQLSTLSFDAATFEVWGALLNGARLEILARAESLSPRELRQALAEREVSVLFLTTALFNAVAAAEPKAFAGLRAVLFGGEAVDPRWVREVLAAGRPGRLLHVYGPTEATTFSSWWPVEEVEASAATVPIGRPVAGAEAYVLGEEMELVGVGAVGELYLGGEGLAWGYLGGAARTASSFVPHPYGPSAGARLYRTGDLVRWQAAGALVFAGRADRQVKLRGFRIEPGEVEAALREHPAVRQALVMVREDRPGDRRLVGYVAAAAAPGLARDLERRLRQRLPEHLVPAALVVLAALPLTANGKIDRAALPPPAAERAALATPYAAPSGEI